MTCHSKRIELLDLVDQAVTAGARRDKACDVIGISSSTLRRWRPAASATVLRDNRPDAIRPKPYNSYTEAERENILHMCNSAEFASLPPAKSSRYWLTGKSILALSLRCTGYSKVPINSITVVEQKQNKNAASPVPILPCLLYTSPSPRD